MPLILLFLFLFTGLVRAHPVNQNTQISVHMEESGFHPPKIQVPKGTTIIFENVGTKDHRPASNVHPTHEVYPSFDPRKPVSPGNSWSFVFEKEGRWDFHDHLYPYLTGLVIVGGEQTAFETQSSLPFASKIKNFLKVTYKSFRSFLGRIYALSLNNGTESLSLECENSDFSCFTQFLRTRTEEFGPKAAIKVLELLQNEGKLGSSVDDHQLAHEIGRQTAESFGVNTEAFLLCPMPSFNGGCQHGFFEYVLGKTTTSAEAADLICGSLEGNYSAKFRFYCYHGVGHGVMMAQAYDLYAALELCDSFKGFMAQDGCWQGVFMENTNAGMRAQARDGLFDKQNLLSPCNKVKEKYKHECYINHAGWLMHILENDVQKASIACLEAEQKYIDSCLQSIGLMVTNPVWQESLYKGDLEGKDFAEISWDLCQMFPQEHITQCVIGTVDNIMNFDELDTERVKNFCSEVLDEYKAVCFQVVGRNLRGQVTDREIVRQKCNMLEAKFREACFSGGGL